MSELRIRSDLLPRSLKRHGKSSIATLRLKRVNVATGAYDGASDAAVPTNVTLDEPRPSERHPNVSFGTITDGPDSGLRVALKSNIFSSTRHSQCFLDEANIYETSAKKLQGEVVPRLHGAFIGTLNGKRVACLLLDYVGPHLNFHFPEEGHKEYKLRIIQQAIKLHEAGIAHGELSAPRHIVDKDGVPFFLDLSTARPHKCLRAMDVDTRRHLPLLREFKCIEIWLLSQELYLWSPYSVTFCYRTVPKADFKTAEELMMQVGMNASDIPVETRAMWLKEAQRVVDTYCT